MLIQSILTPYEEVPLAIRNCLCTYKSKTVKYHKFQIVQLIFILQMTEFRYKEVMEFVFYKSKAKISSQAVWLKSLCL